MAKISTAEAKTFNRHESGQGDRFNELAGKLGQMILDGLDSAKKVGEIVSGFFYFLSPVPKEFNFRTLKTHPDPIIKIRKSMKV